MANRMRKVSATLDLLPPEIVAQIVAHIETARALSHFSLTCKRIYALIENDGFRIFTQSRFPYAESPTTHGLSFWRNAAQGLTTLSRNWERKAFIVRRINPSRDANEDGRRQSRRTQNARNGQVSFSSRKLSCLDISGSRETCFGIPMLQIHLS